MRVLLFQLDGKIPNLALMRIAAHHKALGDEVELRIAGNADACAPRFGDNHECVYASILFRRTLPLAETFLRMYPDAVVGGTGVDPARPTEIVPLSPAIQSEVTALEKHGIVTNECDYSLWPYYRQSIGFTQRGCRMTSDTCPYCCVPQKEGKVRAVGTIHEIWRGDPWPREVLLLDNDFFGQPEWRARIKELQDGNFKVSFNQGINARCLTEEAAEAIASVNYRNDTMDRKRIYTAWDNRKDEERLFLGLARLVKYGVKPDNIMVYVIIGYWSGETMQDCDYRRRRLREFGARPYPMPYVRTRETVGFQRWVIGAYDKPSKKWPQGVSWQQWEAANYRPENLGVKP
jgi:hypothetical protein